MKDISLGDSFRLIGLDQILFDVRADGRMHLLSRFAAHMAPQTAVRPNRLFEAFTKGIHLDADGIRNGVLVVSAVVPGLHGFAWSIARLAAALPCGAADRKPVDLAFAVVGGLHSLSARSVASRLVRLAADDEALFYLRRADTIDLFRAELTAALDKPCDREPVKMTG